MRIKLFLLYFLMQSCAFSDKSQKTSFNILQKTQKQSDYQKSLKENTQYAKIFSNFDTLYDLKVSYVSPKMKKALQKIHSQYNLEAMEKILTDDKNIYFFASIFSPEEDDKNLKDQKTWSIYLAEDKNIPSKIKRVQRKNSWSIYFPYTTPWSSEFIISFPKPKGESLNPQKTMQLIMSNHQAQTTFSW